jgi:hypothetical protein
MALVGEAMSRHLDIDMASFIGSTRAGILLRKARTRGSYSLYNVAIAADDHFGRFAASRKSPLAPNGRRAGCNEQARNAP